MKPTPILLAAGASSRMGRPKALLDFDGVPAFELARRAMADQGPLIVVLGPNHEEVRKQIVLGKARVALNLDVESGQTESLRKALELLPADAPAFLFMPVDFPLVTAADVARLVAAWTSCQDPRKSIFLPSHAMKRGHPVLCRREVAPEFLALPAGASARDVINRDPGRIAYVEYAEPYVLMDMDTPEDYRRCLEAYRVRNARNG